MSKGIKVNKYLLLTISFLSFFTFSNKAQSSEQEKEVRWETLQQLPSEVSSDKFDIAQSEGELKNILNTNISIKGFMLPMDYSSREIREFLLMPYIPSCIHVPPPPPNQIIHVVMGEDKSIPASFYPVEVEGVLSIEENQDFESSYKMVGLSVKELQ